jgi:hypothetical protein
MGVDDPGFDELEREFQIAVDAAALERADLGCPPSQLWSDMSRHLGAAEATRRILLLAQKNEVPNPDRPQVPTLSTGLDQLVAVGRPDLSFEWSALDPRWDAIFHKRERDAARSLLREVGLERPAG